MPIAPQPRWRRRPRRLLLCARYPLGDPQRPQSDCHQLAPRRGHRPRRPPKHQLRVHHPLPEETADIARIKNRRRTYPLTQGAKEFLKQEYCICMLFVAVMYFVIAFLTPQ